MTYFQPRIPWKFTNAAETESFEFPLAEFQFSSDQALHAPEEALAGAHGGYDLLGVGTAPRASGIVRVSFAAYDESPADLEVIVDAMMDKCWRFGRGKLWSRGLDSAGAEQYRWIRARATAMPSINWAAGDVLRKSATVGFRTEAFWHNDQTILELSAAVAATGTITVPVQPTIGDTFTIGTKVFTFVAEVDANANGEVGIGANVAAAQVNIRAAINGTDGFNTAHTQVTCAAFSANVAVVTATTAGQAGMGIAFSETFADGSNVMNGSGFLGGSTAGAGSPYSATLGTFTITNPGNAPIMDAIFTIAASTYTNPLITNITTGYRMRQVRTGTETLVFDAGAHTVTRSGVNDYVNFDRLSGQVGLMRLDPGANSFTVSGFTAGTIAVAAYPAYH